ncbi:MAG: radical SAM protein [Candidatus Omnitrophica bacterium]|nr:radical SAM protein [Candidatus Omnitrophota bacterium]
MNIKAWKLPWQGEMVPHAVIEILRECNISCRACYKICPPEAPKTFVQIREELETLLKMRRLSSVSILGGEVSLHPQLCDIVRMIKDKGLCVEVMTNGVNVDAAFCQRLKKAGLNVLYFHIERGQKRPDLPNNHSSDDLNNLRREKAVIAGKEGLDVGLTVTAYPGELDDIRDIISLTLKTPEINYLLVTLFRDNSGIKSLQGNILSGFSGTGTPPDKSTLQNNNYFAQWIKNEFQLEPFAYMGSSLNPKDPRWLSYLVGTMYKEESLLHTEYVIPSLLEKFLMTLYRIAGRYPMYLEQNAARFRKQLVLNGLLGGRRRANMELLRSYGKPGTRLTTKRLLFQNPAELTTDGRLVHCKWCPDAVLKKGSLVPVCVADNIS